MISKLGAKVHALREAKGWSQSELATHLGLSEKSKGYVSEIESGKKVPTAERVAQLAQIFDVSTDYLLFDDFGKEKDA